MAKFAAPPIELDGFEVVDLSMRRDNEIVYSNMPEPDPRWTYTDKQGHDHYYEDGWPTLEWIDTETYFCPDCHDEHTEGEYRCKRCGEAIRPGTRMPDPGGTVVQGPVHIDATVRGEGPDTFGATVHEIPVTFTRVSFDGEVSTYVGQVETTS